MKVLLNTKGTIAGGDAEAALVVDGTVLKAQVSIGFPLAKLIEPAEKAFDAFLDKAKVLIPGTWDDVMIEQFKAIYKAEINKAMGA